MDWRWTDNLGVALLGAEAPAHATAWARAAESAGLGSVWIVEDYFHPGAFALAGAAAAVTERVTIGLGVVNPYTRHPALLAMETAALAGMAPGRVVLGVGSSNRHWIEEQMAIPFRTPLAAVRECVEIVRRLLDGERLTYRGQCFTLDGVALESAPKAEVPVLLGVKGPRALRLAGEIADGVHCAVLASPAHVRRVRETTAAARRSAAASGASRPGNFVVIGYVLVVMDDDRGRAREAVKPTLARYLGVLHGQSILEDAGLGPAVTKPFREAMLRGEGAVHLVSDDLIDAVAVVGTPDEGRAALGRFAEAGLDCVVAVVPEGVDVAEQVRRLGAVLSPMWSALRRR